MISLYDYSMKGFVSLLAMLLAMRIQQYFILTNTRSNFTVTLCFATKLLQVQLLFISITLGPVISQWNFYFNFLLGLYVMLHCYVH